MECDAERPEELTGVADTGPSTSQAGQAIDTIPPEMTASYSEISEERVVPRPAHLPTRADSLQSGYMHQEGDMTHYVADDVEFKIKLSSPIGKRENPFSSRPSTPSRPPRAPRRQPAPRTGPVDGAVLNDLEGEAQRIAQSVDNLIENLSGILHSNSALTAENMQAYGSAVIKTCDALDANIRSMYTLLAKGEEVSRAMAPVRAQAARVAEIKRVLQIFESCI